jgi:4-amino-4-deoxy-L-arabinose transferase-like glycosyltransferase
LRNGWPLLVLALIVRVAQIAATGDWTAPANSDPADYIRHAVSIAHGDGMAASFLPQGGPSALRPPAYPYFLGGVFAVSGDSFTAGRLASALLGVVSVALIGLIAQILWTRRVALIAMAIAAVYPPLVLLSGTLLSEPLALPLVLGMLYLLLAYRERPRWVAPVAGVLFALALLDRPALVVFAVPLVAALWSSRRELVIALAVAALTIVPWTMRNAVEFDAFVPISTQSGFLVAGTYNATSDKDTNEPGAYRPAVFDPFMATLIANASPSDDENDVSKALGKAGRRYAQDHPGYVPRVLWFNSLRLVGLRHGGSGAKFAYYYQGIGANYAKLARWSWYLLALIAIAGLALGAMRGVPWWLWIVPLLTFVSVIWISGDVRYRVPIEPFAIWCAAYALARLTDRSRAQLPQPTPAPPR